MVKTFLYLVGGIIWFWVMILLAVTSDGSAVLFFILMAALSIIWPLLIFLGLAWIFFWAIGALLSSMIAFV